MSCHNAELHDSIDAKAPTYLMSPEDMKIEIAYAITINPSDDFQYFKYDDDERLEEFIGYWSARIQVMRCDLSLHTEVSKMGRLHFHGIIKFPTIGCIRNFYLTDIRKLSLQSMVQITAITDRVKWDEYCTKSKFLIDRPIKTTDANIKRLAIMTVAAKKVKGINPCAKYKRIDEF